MSDVPMPDWAAESDWCLNQWLPTKGYLGQQTVDTCLLKRLHEGPCRTIHHGFRDNDNAVYIGSLSYR